MTRLSHSGKEKYEQCPYKYYLHYVENMKCSTTSSALCFGNALDLALNDMLSGSSAFASVFDSEWDKYSDTKIDYYKSDLNESLLTEEELRLPVPGQNFISLRRKGHLLLESYRVDILPRIKRVISIQDEMTLQGSCADGEDTNDTIYGKLDLIAEIEDDAGEIKYALLDNKTTSEPYAKDSVQKKDQLALYATGYPDIKTFGYLTLNKKNFKTQVILGEISEDRKQEVLDKFVNVLDRIKTGSFDKNKKSCYAFGRQCEFYSHCHRGYFSKDIYKETKEK